MFGCIFKVYLKNIKTKNIKVIIFSGTRENSGKCRINIFMLYEENFLFMHILVFLVYNHYTKMSSLRMCILTRSSLCL